MSDTMYKLKDMVCDELKKIANDRKLNASTLDAVDKLTHTLKSIENVNAMGSGDRGYSGDAYTHRYVNYPNYTRYDYDRGYSRDEGKIHMVDQLREMLNSAASEKERSAIRNCISQME